MLYRRLGSSGLKVSAVGLGSWLTIGTAVDAAAGRAIVHAARAAGVNLLDTADVYNKGEAERALGVVLKDLPRHELVLATKCFFPMSDDPNDRGLSRKHVHESIRKSLRRLQTDYVDLYQCHRFDPDVPIEETARAMDDLVRQGLVLYWGTSQWPAERIAELVALCRGAGYAQPISNQPLYNLFDRGIERAVLPVSAECGIGQLVYSPLAQGVLTGKYPPGGGAVTGTRSTDAFGSQFVERYLSEPRRQQAAALKRLAESRGLTAGQIALAFCLRLPNVASVLVGARTEQQLRANLTCIGVQIDDRLLAELEVLFPLAEP